MRYENVVVTGIGVSDAEGNPLDAFGSSPSETEYELSEQLIKAGVSKSALRQLGPTSKYAVLAASRALSMAGIADDPMLLSHTDILVACRSTERDAVLDSDILRQCEVQNLRGRDSDSLISKMLLDRLRPTLFLSMIPNLVAANISISLGATGTSRTFLGDDMAGVQAIITACHRINAGNCQIALVGGSVSIDAANTREYLKNPKFDSCRRAQHEPSLSRTTLNSGAAFVVLEHKEVANRRRSKILANLVDIQCSTGIEEGKPSAANAIIYEIAIADSRGGDPGDVDLGQRRPQSVRLADEYGYSFEAAVPLALARAISDLSTGVSPHRSAIVSMRAIAGGSSSICVEV
jgi:3-oxoacyl-[acyl-carrier-protein] synthase II